MSEKEALLVSSHNEAPEQIKLQALLLADHIYRDQDSGKFVIAGTFRQLNLLTFPTTLGKSVGAFVSLTGVANSVNIGLEFVDGESGQVLMDFHGPEFDWEDPGLPVEFGIEIPPLPLPHPGRYLFRLKLNGIVIGTAEVIANLMSDSN